MFKQTIEVPLGEQSDTYEIVIAGALGEIMLRMEITSEGDPVVTVIANHIDQQHKLYVGDVSEDDIRLPLNDSTPHRFGMNEVQGQLDIQLG